MGWWRREGGEDRGRRHDDISTAELGRRLEDHVRVQEKVNDGLDRKLDQHETISEGRHSENINRFARLERTQYLAMGGATVIFWILSEVMRSLH
jgi:hypothetical protein